MSSPFCSRFFPYALLSSIVFLIYSNSLNCAWQFDDITNIIDNQALHLEELTVEGFNRALTADPGKPHGVYRPVACLTFALNYYVGNLNPLCFHATNIAIHILTSIFLFLIISRTLRLPALAARHTSHADSVALLATMLWAVHPIHVQAVTYIVQRMTSLGGFFYILSFYFYLRSRTAPTRKKTILFLVWCALSFLMSFGSKENALLLPFTLFVYELLLLQPSTVSFLRRNKYRIVLLLAAVVIAGVSFLCFRKGGLFGFLGDYDARPFSLVERLLTESRVLLFYLSLLVYPVSTRFSVAHSFPFSTSLLHPVSTLLSVIAILAMLGLLIALARKHPLISFCFLFFFLNHFMESSFLGLELVFEHRNYIPSMFFFLPLAVGWAAVIDSGPSRRHLKIYGYALVVVLIAGFGLSTFTRNYAWKTPETLWKDALQKAPDQLRAHHNLGLHYQKLGRWDEAISCYERALQSHEIHRKDEVLGTLYQLGQAHAEMGDSSKAIFWYLEAIQMASGFSPALVNLAALYDREGDRVRADFYLLKAMEANPADARVNLNMGIYYLRNGLTEKAIEQLVKSTAQKAVRGQALVYLGVAYKQKEWLAKAAGCFEEAAILNPKDLRPRLHLLEVHVRTGHKTIAGQEAAELVQILSRDGRLRQEILGLIVNQGRQNDVALSEDILLPLLSAPDQEP